MKRFKSMDRKGTVRCAVCLTTFVQLFQRVHVSLRLIHRGCDVKLHRAVLSFQAALAGLTKRINSYFHRHKGSTSSRMEVTAIYSRWYTWEVVLQARWPRQDP